MSEQDSLSKVQQLLTEFMAADISSSEDAQQWLVDNESRMTDAELYNFVLLAGQSENLALNRPNTDSDRVNRIISQADSGEHSDWVLDGVDKLEIPTKSDLEDKAAQIVGNSGNGPISVDLNQDGTIDAAEKAAVDKAKANAAKALAESNNISEEEAQDLVDGQVNNASGGLQPVPDILLQYMGRNIQVGYDAGMEARIGELIRTWNEFNPDRPVSDKDGLFAVLKNPNDPDVKQAMDATFFGVDPVVAYTVKLSNGTSITVDANQFAAYDSIYGSAGADRGGLTNLVRSADRTQIQSGSGMPAWQILASLAKAKNQPVTDAAYQGPKDAVDVMPSNWRASQLDSLGVKFKEGQWIYHGNDTLAYIHALNPTLAAKVSGDPKQLSQSDWRSFNQYLIDGGFDQTALAKMGYYALGLDEWNQLADGNGSGAAGSGATRMKPDPEAIKQAARDLYRQLFAAEPTDAQLASIVGSINSTVSSAADDQSIDVSAQIRKSVESDPQYKELYGSMPAGMTPEEYQAQYRAGAATLLGNEAPDPNAIRSGMRSGNYQTTLGRVAGGQKAWNNSAFLGRLAQAAQVVSEST